MAGEEWARRIIEKELKQSVVINDDNSLPGMYDLRIGPLNRPDIAIECVGAVDSMFTETWNVGPARGPFSLAIEGDWHIEIASSARVKAVRQNLQCLLKKLESRRIYNLRIDHRLRWSDATLFAEFDLLGITHVFCYSMPGNGNVHLGMPGTGGAVDIKGREVPKWLGEFLRNPAYEDVLLKLQKSGAKDRHAFIIASYGGTPWTVESYLMGQLDYLPNTSPDLPPSVTAVWLVSGFGQKGIYWDGNIWRTVDVRGEGIDD